MTHRVVWREQATADLRTIFYWTADGATPEVALRYAQRIEAAAEKLADFPNRGTPHDAIRAGLRSIPVGRSVTIFYEVGTSDVQILRVIHARRDTSAAFAAE